MSTDIEDDAKAALRDEARNLRADIGSTERAEAASAAAEHFFASVELTPDLVVAAYWPIRDELDCKPVLTRLMDAGQKVCLPVVKGDEEPLDFRVWEITAPLFPEGFGALVPPDDAPLAEPDLIIVPLLGFDKTGTRLGYGRGYYDRTVLKFKKKPLMIGYAFATQELEDIPRAKHDVPLDMVVTETGVRNFAKSAN